MKNRIFDTAREITVREVRSKRDRRLFVDFPNKLYRDNPYYVPPMYADELADMDARKNPAFSYAQAKYFLAYRDGRIVGRIGAIYSTRANERWGARRMRFTQVDFIDDESVSAALFAAVEAYAREKECFEVHGPLGFTDLDREGMLVEGFEEKGLFFTYYNAPYYKEHLARLGYRKDVDWVELNVHRTEDDSKTAELLAKLSARALKRHNLHVVTVHRNRDFTPYIERAFALVNRAYAPLYGVVPLDEVQIRHYAKKFVPMIDPDLACLVENEEGELIAFGAAVRSLSDAFRKTGGRLFPFGWIPTLRALKHGSEINLLLIAVEPEYQGTGVNAVIIHKLLENAWRVGVMCAETGPQLEMNDKVLDQWKIFPSRQHKRRRCFIKQINTNE